MGPQPSFKVKCHGRQKFNFIVSLLTYFNFRIGHPFDHLNEGKTPEIALPKLKFPVSKHATQNRNSGSNLLGNGNTSCQRLDNSYNLLLKDRNTNELKRDLVYRHAKLVSINYQIGSVPSGAYPAVAF